MIDSIDHLIIAVENLNKAESNYQKIFGFPPVWQSEHEKLGTRNSIFNFSNTYIELLSASGKGVGADFVGKILSTQGEGLCGIAFGTSNIEKIKTELWQKGFVDARLSAGEGVNQKKNKIRHWNNLFLPVELMRGLFAFVIEHVEGELPIKDVGASGVRKLDHVVINTADADKFIEVYHEFFNIRLALDTFMEHWGRRMLFFRVNKTTLEVIEKKEEKIDDDRLWGLAWEVENLDAACERLILAGIEVSKIKNGLKKGTRVATIKSHNHNVPTLLIQYV